MSLVVRRGLLRLHEFSTGRHVLERLDELNQTQWLGRDELMALQRAKLQRLVEYAYQYVPYYRRIFGEAGFHPDDLRKDPACLTRLPILTKAIIRENFQDMLTTEPERRQRLSKLSTSGSTGQPLIFMQDPDYRDAVTADIQRHIGWAGCELGDLHAMIWGASIHMALRKKLRMQLIDWVWNRFQINAFLMSDEAMAAFAARVRRQKPRVLFGYPSSMHRFAQFVRHNAYEDICFDGIFSSSETLISPVRQFIEETFRCKVFDRYGTLDLGGIGCECEAHTGLHTSVENNYVEILRDGNPAEPGEVGDLIVTNLNNLGMPFIRYSIGDAGAWYTGDHCPCRRAAPMLKAIEGRVMYAFKARDGRTVWAAFTGVGFRCLAHPTIKQFQVIQKSLDKIVVRLVPDGEIPQSVMDEITQTMQATFGSNVVVDFEFPDEITPLPSGKHQYAISELNSP
jgi:phenylacetate-CoA ligase